MKNYDFNSAKEAYRAFCENRNNDIQIFAQPWYLDAVCDSPDDWRVIIYQEGEQIVAAFPFLYTRSRKGICTISNPWMAPRLGIWMDYGNREKRQKKETFENDVVSFIISNLPDYDIFHIAFDNRFKNWREFYNAGFSSTVHYSYILHKEEISDNYMDQLTSAPRRSIRNAQKTLNLIIKNQYDECFDFILSTYEKRGLTISYTRDSYNKLYSAVQEHNAGTVYWALGENEKPFAIAVIVRDRLRAYHMLSAYEPDGPRGAQSMLVYQAILDASANGLGFDFEGSMIPGVAKYNSEFNAELEPYYIITKYSPRMRFYNNIRENLSIMGGWLKTKKKEHKNED